MNMTTIVFAHPWHGSFNKAILDTVTSKLTAENKPFQIIDLPKDGFNPVFTEEELALFNKGMALDPLVLKYQEMIKATKEIIFIFPIWWGTVPAILKGFFDKVLLRGFAYTANEEGHLIPLLDIAKSSVITTSQAPSEIFESYMNGYFKAFFMDAVGMKNLQWINCDNTSMGPDEHRKAFLEKVEKSI